MARIFEIFGYRVDDSSQEAESHRRMAHCPFMDSDCDGGGNRYLTTINLTRSDELRRLFPGRDSVVPGVCSIKPSDSQPPWIVCPRRLLVLGRENPATRTYQRHLEERLFGILGYESGTRLGIWKEVKIKYSGKVNGIDKEFDYTFDYVVMPLGRVSINDAMISVLGVEPLTVTPSQSERFVKMLSSNGFTITSDSQSAGGLVVEAFPYGVPSIVEIMTSSTSGGNKKSRSQIPQAFEDAMLGLTHKAPGINYRQVWARMASQLLVKSEVAAGWGGKAIWIVQDVLVDYISKSTGLDIRDFVRDTVDQVNMLSFSYGDLESLPKEGAIDLPKVELFSGQIAVSLGGAEESSFSDIVRLPIQPPLAKLVSNLVSSGPKESHLSIVVP